MKKYLLLLFIFLSGALLNAQSYSRLDRIVEKGIKNKIFPGAAVFVGSKEGFLYQNYYGSFDFETNSPKVDKNSLFDLASLTKVFATTLCVMKLYDEGKIDLEERVVKYLPEFGQNGKDKVKIRNLLLHNSGMPAYYTPQSGQSRKDILDAIMALSPVYKTDSSTVYSCLNFVTLMRVVESIAGKEMRRYYKESIADPLGLNNIGFVPSEEDKKRCLPTSPDLQGVVHDPLARGLEGLSGNAGLFSNAEDLGKICLMLLRGGSYAGKKIFSKETVDLFTKNYSKASSRGLGWDTNVFENTSAGTMFSPLSYGHTGYTGTSIWIDPTRELFFLFLTNRVYPDDKASVGSIRKQAADAVVIDFEHLPHTPRSSFFLIDDDWRAELVWNSNNEGGETDKTELWINAGKGFNKVKDFSPDKNVYEVKIEEKYHKTLINAKLINMREFYGVKTSSPSHIFSVRGKNKDALIVDGISEIGNDRKKYYLAPLYLAEALPEDVDIQSVSSEMIKNGKVSINDFKYVFWLLGEENSPDETFNETEREIVEKYLAKGGNLFVSGAEIGWALGRKESKDEEREFYNNVLKANFGGDNSRSKSTAGIEGSIFEGLNFSFDDSLSIYPVGYPDYIEPFGQSKACLKYSNDRIAAVYCAENGKLIHLAFPFETITDPDARKALIEKAINWYKK